MFEIKKGVQKPPETIKEPLFDFSKLTNDMAMVIEPTDGDVFEKLASRVRNYAVVWRKKNNNAKLSVFIIPDREEIQVFRN